MTTRERQGAAFAASIRRAVTMSAGEMTSKVAVAAAFMWLARTLRPGVYGQVEWALSMLTVATLASDAGLGTWATAEIGRRPDAAPLLVAQIGWARLGLSLAASSVLLLLAWARGGGAGAALAVYAAVLLLTPAQLPYLFNGLLRASWAGTLSAVRGVAFAAAVLLLVRGGAAATSVARAELMGAAAAAVCGVLALGRVLGSPVPIWSGRAGASHLLAHSWPIGASELTWGLLWYGGVMLLGARGQTEDAAWQSAALRLVMALHTLVWIHLYVMLPSLARTITGDVDAWRRTISSSLSLAAWCGGLLALGGTLGARTIVTLVFGPAFAPAAPVLRIAVWVLPVVWLSGHLRYSFIAASQARLDYRAAWIGALTVLALTIAFVPALRSRGAALGLLGGAMANGVAALVQARTALPALELPPGVWRAGLACLACLGLGAILTPAAGELGATLASVLLFATLALVVERPRWPSLHAHADN